MKHLLSGVAIAAALAVAAPVWAQGPKASGGGYISPSAPPAAAAPAAAPMAAAPMAPMAPMAGKQRHKRMMGHMARHRAMSAGDQMTNQLNREELARLQGGAMPPPPPPPRPAALQGPKASGGGSVK